MMLIWRWVDLNGQIEPSLIQELLHILFFLQMYFHIKFRLSWLFRLLHNYTAWIANSARLWILASTSRSPLSLLGVDS
jgi:hypothetical protein